MCVWFRKVDKGPDQNKAPTRIHPAPRSGPYCVYGVNDDGIYTYTKHTRVQASMSSGVRATEVMVAFASDLRGLGQLEADRQCYCAEWKDEATQGQSEKEEKDEGGDANLFQLQCFTKLNPNRPVQGECMVYRSLTSVCAVHRKRKWLLMQSRSHLHPIAHSR